MFGTRIAVLCPPPTADFLAAELNQFFRGPWSQRREVLESFKNLSSWKKKKETPRNKRRRGTVAQADWALLERKTFMLDESQVTLIRA